MTYEPKNAYRTKTCRTERYLKGCCFLKKQQLTHARARVRARGKQFERPYGPCHGPCAPPLRGGDWWPGERGYAPQSSPPRGANGPQGLRAPRNRLRPIPHLRTNTPRATACSRADVFGGLRSSIRLGGSKPYRAGSYRLTPASTGRRGKHVIVPGNRMWFAKAQKTGYQKGEGCLGLGE